MRKGGQSVFKIKYEEIRKICVSFVQCGSVCFQCKIMSFDCDCYFMFVALCVCVCVACVLFRFFYVRCVCCKKLSVLTCFTSLFSFCCWLRAQEFMKKAYDKTGLLQEREKTKKTFQIHFLWFFSSSFSLSYKIWFFVVVAAFFLFTFFCVCYLHVAIINQSYVIS